MSFVNKEEQKFSTPFKKHEFILNNKNEPFENKLESIIEVWKSVGELNLSQFDLRHVVQIMDWAKLHALNIVLTAEWNGFKDTYQPRLLHEIEKAQNELLKLNNGFATRCKKLADVVKNPWEDPVLMKLMKTKDAEIDEPEIEFFCVETAYLVSVRLKKLCESQCEDLALNLVTAFMNCYKISKTQNFNLSASETQIWFIYDIHIALLYKFQERQKIVVLLKELSFTQGLQLVKRFAKKRVKIAKIWKNCHRVAVLAVQMYISQAVVKYADDLKDILINYLEIYLNLCNSENLLNDFTVSVRRISNLADAGGLYIFCDVIQRKAGTKLKPFVIELYIRALTTDMNELERRKDANEIDKVVATTSRLAAAFCNLADFLNEHVKAARECVLTAFSLEPTKERLKMIEDLARKSGFNVLDTGQEWKCKLHPPALPSDEITWKCQECGDWMCKPQLNLPTINMTLNEALQNSVLGISESLCDDLVVCLSNPRYQILSWFLPWDDLQRLCIMYLQDPQTTKNFVTELKFVDIDYSIFKHIKREPIDEYAGIERGYEQYLDQDFVSGEESSGEDDDDDSEDSLSQDSRPYSLGSDGAGEGPYIPLLPFAPKSDPNILKSLRMFRPNLKRKEKESVEGSPKKILKQDASSCVTPPRSDINTSLSHYLNGVSAISNYNTQNIPIIDPGNSQETHSKNVKAATLPLLGGQVAKKEAKSIQVHLQPLNLSCLKPTVTPLKILSDQSILEIKKELKVKLLNKQLQSGYKEKNSTKKKPPYKSCTKTQLKINKKSSQTESEVNLQLKKLTVEVPIQETLHLSPICPTKTDKALVHSPPPLVPLEKNQKSLISQKNTCQRTYPPDPKIFQRKNIQEKRTLHNQIQQTNIKCTKSEVVQANNFHTSTKQDITTKPTPHRSLANQENKNICQPPSIPSNHTSINILPKPCQDLPKPCQDMKILEKVQPKCPPTSLTAPVNQNKQLMTCSSKSSLPHSIETKISVPAKLTQPQFNQETLTVMEQVKPDLAVLIPQVKSDQPLVNTEPVLQSLKLLHSKTLQNPVLQHSKPSPLISTLNEVDQLEQELKEILVKSKQETCSLLKLENHENKQSQVNNPPKDKKMKLENSQLQLNQEKTSVIILNPEEKNSLKLNQSSVKQIEDTFKVEQTCLHQTKPSQSVNSPRIIVQQNTVIVKARQEQLSTTQPQKESLILKQKEKLTPPETYQKLPTNLFQVSHCQAALKSQSTITPVSQFQHKSLEISTISSPISTPVKQQSNPVSLKNSSLNLNHSQTCLINKIEVTSNPSEIKQDPVINPISKLDQVKNPVTQLKKAKTLPCPPMVPLQKLAKQTVPSKCYQQSRNSQNPLQNCQLSNPVVPPQQHNIQISPNTSTLQQKHQQITLSPPLNCQNQPKKQDKLSNCYKSVPIPALGKEAAVTSSVVSKTQMDTQNKHLNLCLSSVNRFHSQETTSSIPRLQKQLTQENCSNNPSLKLSQLHNNSCSLPKVASHSPNSEKQLLLTQPPQQNNTVPKSDPNKNKVIHQKTKVNILEKRYSPISLQQQILNQYQHLNSETVISSNSSRQSNQEIKPALNLEQQQTQPLILNSTMFKWEKTLPSNQDHLAIVTPKLGKALCSSKLVPKQTKNMDRKIVPNLVKVRTNPALKLDITRRKVKVPGLVENKLKTSKSSQESKKNSKQTENCLKVRNSENQQDCVKKTSCTSLETLFQSKIVTQRNKDSKGIILNECNNNNNEGKCLSKETKEVESLEQIDKELVQESCKNDSFNSIDCGLFWDLSETEKVEKIPERCKEKKIIESIEDLPKNFNLTENIRTYGRKPNKKQQGVNKDCIKALIESEVFNACRNVNSSFSIDLQHSNVQNSPNKELKVVLFRLPSNTEIEGKCTKNNDENPSIKQKCDRGRTPPKTPRQRKSFDKSENKIGKAPNLVQNHNMNPLQDINPRVTPKTNFKSCCDLNKSNSSEDTKLTDHNDKSAVKKGFAKSVLAKIPGLNDFQMMRPLNVDHIVNVVQVSGTRATQNVPIQNSQTSTQVTPHIQRIGQPRVSDQKPEQVTTTTVTSVTISNTTTSVAKTTTTQPSTLINILSQQVVRPAQTQGNIVRRQTPYINILSQQVVRPPINQKTTVTTTNTTVSVSESTSLSNQVKTTVTTASNEPIIINQVAASAMKPAGSIKSVSAAAPGQGGTILQFICKSSLPKFQQAFGKTVYQSGTESVDSTTTTLEASTTSETKKTITKTVPVNVQPIQGSVIYSRQVPVGQTISLIPPGGTTRQVFRIATSNPDQISLVKDSVIHSKMSALLAAALQGRPKNVDGEVQINCDETTKVTLTRPTLVQNARIVKPVQLQLPTNVVRTTPQTNLSSTTLEQLREFDMVYKQIKERSSSTNPGETSNNSAENQEVTPQRISVTYVNQLPKYTQLSPVVVVTSYSSLQPAASPALSVTSQRSSSPCLTPSSTPTLPKIVTKNSKGKTFKNTTSNSNAKSSPIPKPQQKPQEDEHTTQRIFDILAEYAEQLRNSPDLNNKPAPRRRSNPPTNPNQSSKRKKSSSAKKAGQSSSTVEIDTDDLTVGSEDSSGGGIIQLSVTDDEQSQAATTVTTPESTENSNPSSSRPVILAESTSVGTQSRNVIIADSSVGEALKIPNTAVIVPGSYIMPVSMVKGAPQIAVVSGGSKILATVPARSGQNMLLFQSFTNQTRKGAISAVKYSTIQPISGISSQSLAGVSAQPPVILPSNSVATAVALSGQLALKKIEEREADLLLTISSHKEESKCINDITHPDSSTSASTDSSDIKIKIEEQSLQSDNSNEKIFQTYQKSVITNSVGTSVIATASASIKQEDNGAQNIISINLPPDSIKSESKTSERMQSVLVTACSSNGPMLSHSTPRYRKTADIVRVNNSEVPHKEELLHNGEKSNNNDQKTYRGNVTYYSNKAKKVSIESQKMDSEMQKQAAIERELRLQKSLSEECEDLGVDEPSTSDLFPEADLLFDSNHSPSFDQTSQDIIKRTPQTSEIKEEVKASMNLFSDDETSSSLRTDLFEYVEYQTVDTALDYQARQLMNGNTTGTESGSSGCEDNTLLPKCATMSDVTLNSPISPEMYQETSLNKYKFKYTNRKKGDKAKASEFIGEIVSSSEDTIGSSELGKTHCEVVHVAIAKNMHTKEDEKCELHCDEDRDSPSGRGARRSVRKLCSCCNGLQDGNISRKRPHSSRPQTPAPHKKAFLTKKR